MKSDTYTLYEMADSGNCYKVRLCCAQLGIALERKPVNILNGESRTEAFLKLNPNGRIPLLQLPDGRLLAESNAMLGYLAADTELLPSGRFDKALVQQWLFFEQYSHERFIATNRYWRHILCEPEQFAEQIAANEGPGYAALDVMEGVLATAPFIATSRYTIADIALYAYTHVASEGGFDLSAYPAIQAWLARVAQQPGHVSMSA